MNNYNHCNNFRSPLAAVLLKRPNASAKVRPALNGLVNGYVNFYQTNCGVLVMAEISNLPSNRENCGRNVFGFHIHEGMRCSGNSEDPFADAMGHYNPGNCEHPHHAGDMPPLFENGGHAFSVFLTDRFTVNEVIGRTVIIHSKPDDFTTQPSGDSGSKIACGIIRKY